MKLSELQLILECLEDWTHQRHDDAVQLVKRKIANKKKNLLSQLPPHQSHSDTSVAAAVAKIPTFSGERLKVLRELSVYSMTDEEGQHYLGMSGNSYRPARVQLMDAGLVEDSQERRKTGANRLAVVWQITPMGRQYLSEQS